jgi:hypothetical protein
MLEIVLAIFMLKGPFNWCNQFSQYPGFFFFGKFPLRLRGNRVDFVASLFSMMFLCYFTSVNHNDRCFTIRSIVIQ